MSGHSLGGKPHPYGNPPVHDRVHSARDGHRRKASVSGPDAPALHQRVVPIVRRKGPADRDLEGLISSAMLASDKQLANVVNEVEAISKALETGDVDAKSLRSVVHPAVWYAVKHVLIERELRQLALTDDLTCFYNRRGFLAAATQQMKLARRNSHSMLLFYCDLDNLKFINDSFGHREGDRALVRAADALEEVFRDSDILARLGGDEFAVLAFEASPRNQDTILHRIEKTLHKANEDDPRYALSFSVGVARFDPVDAADLADLMAQADSAMYEKKRAKHTPLSRNA
jgi:diguanylate cyclase (GGDEF)-like protein